MTNFIFKSPRRLIKNESIQLGKLEVLNQNVLYCTHSLDKLHEKLDRLLVDKHLQMQVDEYFDKDSQEQNPEDL